MAPQKVLLVLISLSLLKNPASTKEQGSLWGNAADFNSKCNHWTLNQQVSIPALQEFTVCFYLKLEVQGFVPWTAFMYRHSEVTNSELGFGGQGGQIVVSLFGVKWTTRKIILKASQWYMMCLTWTHSKEKPTLYINGTPEDIVAESTSFTSTSCCKLAPNGTLTLGATHELVDGKIQIIAHTSMLGQLSLFRLWKRERSQQEVTSLKCTEGDLVIWRTDYWDTGTCLTTCDSGLSCEWSIYKVKLIFVILNYEDSDFNNARDIAYQWLGDVLPDNIYLHDLSVFEVTRASAEGSRVKPGNDDIQVWWIPPSKMFNCLIHVTVSPSLDVAEMQAKMYTVLKNPYHPPDGLQQLLVDGKSIQTIAVESFPAPSTSPPVVTESSPATTTIKTTTITTSGTTNTAAPTTFTTTAPNITDLYFQVKLNVSMKGDGDTEQTLSLWVNSSLADNMMMLLNLHLLPPYQSRCPKIHSNFLASDVFVYGVLRVSCVFQVLVTNSLSDTEEMEKQIRDLLLVPYDNGTIAISTEDIQIRRIFTVNCNAETTVTENGLFKWPVTSGGTNATVPCPNNPCFYATRHCKLCLRTHWLFPDLDRCSSLVQSIPDLDQIKVTADNALKVVEMIHSLIKNQSTLNYSDLSTVLNKLEDIVNISVVTLTLGQDLINIISDILDSNSDLLPFTNIILNITESVGGRIVGYEDSATLVAPAIAISVVDISRGQFNSLTFGVSSDRAGRKPEIFINRHPFNGTVAFISLPSVLQSSFPQNSWNPTPPRVMFQFYSIPMLFGGSEKGQILNTFVAAASVMNASSPIQDLDEYVEVTLQHLTPNTLHNDVQCAYWNYSKNNGHGGWDDYGCREYNTSSDYTTCLCNHLTHFGVLLDVSRTPVDSDNEQILTIVTNLGCGVSSLFLGITILTYTAFEKLRRDYPSRILINLSLALLGLNLVFLVNSWLSSWGLYGLCVAVASILHYFLLASFTWMGLEAIHMYFALVKVFNVYVPSYIFKFCTVGWGVPLVICSMVFIVNHDAYGSDLYLNTQPLDNSQNFCFLQDNVAFYVSVVAYAVLIFLFNIAIFVVVLIQIHHIHVNSPAGTRRRLIHDLKGVASLTLLLGLTWTTGFFTWGPARLLMLYLFSGLNSLQGLFIFLFHCLMKENVRKQWRIHLCFGRFRLEDYSEWSNSATVGGMAKVRSNPPRTSIPSVHSVKSSSTDSTSASSDYSQRDSSCRRPNLGLFVNSLALPRAHSSTSGTGVVPSHRGIIPTPGWRNHLLYQKQQR